MKSFIIILVCGFFVSNIIKCCDACWNNPSLEKKNVSADEYQKIGFITVRPKAHLFYWLYYTTASEEKPLIIWLQGGPGVSAAYGLFEEIGPYNTNLTHRNHTWIKNYNVIFIDNPVGTGFSYVEDEAAYCQNNYQIAKDLMVFMKEFLEQNPKFKATPTYLIGKSFGGQYAAVFSNLWYQEQKAKNIDSNFKGVGFMSALISPNDRYLSMPSYLFNLGIIDNIEFEQLKNEVDEFMKAAEPKDLRSRMIAIAKLDRFIRKLTAGNNLYKLTSKVKSNYTVTVYSQELKDLMKRIQNHLGLQRAWGDQENFVKQFLFTELRKSVVDQVEKILNETDLRVYIINGQLDTLGNVPGVFAWIKKLNWPFINNWLGTPKIPLVINNTLEGYSKSYEKLKFFLVHRSGHSITIDNPAAVEYILEDLIYGST